jgi:NADPH:quinone reductase-like Zn-dependent oxidoreductase
MLRAASQGRRTVTETATVVQYSRIGGPEVLELVEVARPVPAAGQVLVEVLTVGVNPIDGKLRAGIRTSPPITTPRRTGSDAAGIIAALGDGVHDWEVGDEVIVSASGAYATFLAVDATRITRKPEAWTWEQAAAVGVPVGTAYQALRSLGVTAGKTLLVHAGSGAVGQAAIQFAVAWGATVVATAGPARQELVRFLGATPVEYGDGLLDRIRAAAPQGVDLVLDAAGTDEALEASFALVSDRQNIGTIVVGYRAAELGIRAWSGGNPVPLTDEEQRLRREGVPAAAALAERDEFDVEVAEALPLAEAAEAQRRVETGEATGKIVLLA